MSSHQLLGRSVRGGVASLLLAGVCSASGCAWDHFQFLTPKADVPPPAESLTIRGDEVQEERKLDPNSPEGRLAGALELFRRGEYAKAEPIFDHLSQKSKYPQRIAEEATFYTAECLRLQGHYPKAADTYTRLMRDFPSNPYREQSLKHMFTIANYWLDDTREEMKQASQVQKGERWFTTPHFLHWEKSKPLFDTEGRALEKLEQVHYNDINGAMGLGDKALFLCGSVKFFNEDYREADHFFTQIHEYHPNSPLAAKAVELAIISKHLSTGGADYDARKVAEARILVHSALNNYPELRDKKDEFLRKQLMSITLQQADKDYRIAEFYRRTGHPASAYFYYEIVRRRYPNTRFFDMATERMHELRSKVEKEQGGVVMPPISGGGGGTTTPGSELPAPRPGPGGSGGTLPTPQPVPGGSGGTLPAPQPVPGGSGGTLPTPRPLPPTLNR